MKKMNLIELILICTVTIALISCSEESSETTPKEANVRVELSFSDNYASYSWLMGFQLISTSPHVSISGHHWDEIVYPEEFVSWLNVRDEPIEAKQYEMETTTKVSAVTLSATAEAMGEPSNPDVLTVTARVYADDILIQTESVVFQPNQLSYWSVVITNSEFK